MSKKKDIIVNETKEEIVNEEVAKENLETVEGSIVVEKITEEPIEEEPVVEDTNELNTESEENPIEEEIVEDEVIESDEELVEESVSVIPTVSNNPKQRKIVIATPTYFVVENDGTNIVVYEQNSYRRGDTVLY